MKEMNMPGFRFYPAEEELISFYLHNKLDDQDKKHDLRQLMDMVIPVVDIYDYNPWDLPQISGEACRGDKEQWFFFIPRQESEARGGRPRRLTDTGYWKATGSPSHVYSSDNKTIGMKRTMVFYSGRAPNGKKTEWKMNEYRAIKDQLESTYSASSSTATAAAPSAVAMPLLRQEFSICRIYKRSKCLRAFDRRPLPRTREIGGYPSIGTSSGVPQAQQDDHDVDHNWPPVVQGNTPLTISSPESSFSGDHGQPSHEGQGADQMNVDDEPLWDWEHFLFGM